MSNTRRCFIPDLLHFKEDADEDLHDHVEDEVADADVDAHVSEEPPDLPPPFRVVDQHGAIRHRPVPSYLEVVGL